MSYSKTPSSLISLQVFKKKNSKNLAKIISNFKNFMKKHNSPLESILMSNDFEKRKNSESLFHLENE